MDVLRQEKAHSAGKEDILSVVYNEITTKAGLELTTNFSF